MKEERYHRLMAIQAKVSEERNRDLEGSVHPFIVEELTDESGHLQAVGRLDIQAPEVDGLTYVEDAKGLKEGDIIPVRVVQGFAYDVIAERI